MKKLIDTINTDNEPNILNDMVFGSVGLKTNNMQETLEETAERLVNRPYGNIVSKSSFIEGAKWQQEQILQFLYSEITERRPYSSSKMCEVVIEFIEQFKKK